MTSLKLAFGSFALGAAAIGFAAVAVAQMEPVRPMQVGGTASAGPQFGFFQANQPSSSNRVGLFVARRDNGATTLYYCSSPVDANAKEPGACKQIKGFPSR